MTKEQRTIQLLTKGWLTPLDSALKGGVLSLSQRVSEWRGSQKYIGLPNARKVIHYRIEDRWQKTKSGSRVKAYRLVRV